MKRIIIAALLLYAVGAWGQTVGDPLLYGDSHDTVNPDCRVTRTATDVLTMETPCKVTLNDTTYTFSADALIDVAAAQTGTVYVFVNSSGTVIVGNTITLDSCTNCTESGDTSYAANSFHIASWAVTSGTWATTGTDDRGFNRDFYTGGTGINIASNVISVGSNVVLNDQNNSLGAFYVDIDGISVPSNPAAGFRRLFVDSVDDVLKVRTAGGTTVSLESAGGSPALDAVTNPVAAKTFTFDVAETLVFTNTGAFGAINAFQFSQTTGNPTAGTVLDVRAADSDVDVLRAGDGTNGIVVSQAGAMTAEGTGSITATLGDNAGSFFATGELEDARVVDTLTLTSVGQAGDVDMTGIADGECLVYDGVTDNRLEPGACGAGGSSAWSALTAPTGAVSMVSDATGETATFDFQSAFTTGTQFLVQGGVTGDPSGGVIFGVNSGDADILEAVLTRNSTSILPVLTLQNDGAGDASMDFTITGRTWTIGVDNGTSDRFSISSLAGLGAQDRLSIGTNGFLTIPVIPNGQAFWTDGSGTLQVNTTPDFGALTSFEVPNGAAPTTDAFGEIAGDNDSWAASRGAPQWFDGTANVYLVGTLATDVPTNGQVPKWQTGGTILWEDDASGGTPSLDSVTDPAAAKTFTHDVAETLAFVNAGSFGAINAFQFRQDTGNPTAGTLFDLRAADAQVTVLRAGDGTNGITLSQAGALTAEGTGAITATTAAALAANGANCSAGNYPLGVDAAGAVESCTADDDVPEAADFGAAAALDGTTGALVANAADSAAYTDGSVDVEHVEDDLKTFHDCQSLVDLNTAIPATADIPSFFGEFPFAFTVTKIWCETDANTATINLQTDDGTPADVATADLVCDTTEQDVCASGCDITATPFTAEAAVQIGEQLDLDIVSLGAINRLNVCVTGLIQ